VHLELYNTLGRNMQRFEPLRADRVGMYACGPTVYNYPHIGNLRTYVFEDVLRRTLEYIGYEVEHVMNVTDVGHLTDDADEGEDKIIKSAREKKKTVWEIAQFYTEAFFDDIDRLNILRPTKICKATDHIGDMIELIAKLEEKGYTYEAGGNVYFDISRFPDYGRLALLDRGDLKAGARIEVDRNKRNPHDFVLWFTKGKFEHQAMLWDSPWGNGYPGWHIECSAMSMRYLGEQLDIHCGGVDHIAVHHTNEIAQSQAASGKKWVNFWIHGEHLLMDKAKMSKSKGGFLTLQTLIDRGFEPLDYRYYLLGAHYRTQLQFSFEALEAARNARRRLQERIGALKEELEGEEIRPEEMHAKGHELGSDLRGPAARYMDAFDRYALSDLNMPRCLSEMWGMLRDAEIDRPDLLRGLYRMDRILGLKLSETERINPELDAELEGLIQEREEARKSKDYQRADEIREQLRKRGVALEDTPEGVRWSRL
jgi:cysteinyl-tRNA synthetase